MNVKTESEGNAAAPVDRIVAAIRDKQALQLDIPLRVFRDAYNQLKGSAELAGTRWLLVFVGDQVIAQPLLREDVLLTIVESRSRFYDTSDFDFADELHAAMLGSTNGHYGVVPFLREVFRWQWVLAWLSLTVAAIGVGYGYVSPQVMQTVSAALIQALAVYVSMFVLFALSVRPETEYGIAESDKLHSLSQSDRYIGVVGVGSVVCALANLAASAAFESWTPGFSVFWWVRAVQAVTFAIAGVGTLLSFWLLVTYHMRRRQELTALTMAGFVLKNRQAQIRRLLYGSQDVEPN